MHRLLRPLPRRMRVLSALLALTVPAWLVRAAPPPGGGPVLSALVTVNGASVAERFEELAGPASDARAAVVLAADMDDDLADAEAVVMERQAPVVAAARRLGIQVVSRYSTGANGLLVHATSSQLSELERLPGVERIEPALRFRPTLSNSVPHIGADDLAASLGYDGHGAVVAVVDSGIDYTHADFGGPGVPAAYEAAALAAETITDTWQGAMLFPSAKIIGGWDFVGPNYTTPALCRPEDEAAGKCTSTPHPDPDPLDRLGHGTHVAGIVAGQGVGDVYHGVAPGAVLVALKIFGPPARGLGVDEEADMVVDAIEWCTRVNLSRPVPGTAPQHVDVINMSLGEEYAQGSRLFDRAVEAAVDAGIVVVASAGNEGTRPFVLSAPAASPNVLGVAGSLPPREGDPGDAVWSGSARGPSKNGALKPDITAPASGIFSAARATGDGGSAANGTSAASPHVAGAAALMRHRSDVEALGLGALDLAALLMNYAQPVVYESVGGESRPVAVTRQGAGRLDVLAAGRGKLLVRVGDMASINLGPISLHRPERFSRRLTVRNLSADTVWFTVSARFRDDDDAGRGISVEVPEPIGDRPIRIPGRGLIEVPVEFQADPVGFSAWSIRGQPATSAATLDELEIDGYLTLSPVTEGGERSADEPVVSVPFYVLPRRASRVHSAGSVAPKEGAGGRLSFANEASFAGDVELFVVPKGAETEDPDERDIAHELDMRRVGVRYGPATGPADQKQLTFGIGLYDAAPVPQVSSYEVYLDTDRDGDPDRRVRTGTQRALGGGGSSEQMVVAVGRWDSQAGTVQDELVVANQPADLYSRVAMFGVPISALGLDEPAPLEFYVVHRGLNEDWLHTPRTDVAPDGAAEPGGPRYRFDLGQVAYEPTRWSLSVEAEQASAVELQPGPGGWAHSFLAVYPDNQFEWRDAQTSVVQPGSGPAPPPGPQPIYLPVTLYAHNIYVVPPPNVMVRQALDALGEVSRLRMVYDVENYVNAAESAQRKYWFDGREGIWMITSYRTGVRVEFSRWLDRGWIKRPGDDWRCWAIDEHMLLWPEMVDRLRREYPAKGWRFDGTGRGRRGGREVWKRAATRCRRAE